MDLGFLISPGIVELFGVCHWLNLEISRRMVGSRGEMDDSGTISRVYSTSARTIEKLLEILLCID